MNSGNSHSYILQLALRIKIEFNRLQKYIQKLLFNRLLIVFIFNYRLNVFEE